MSTNQLPDSSPDESWSLDQLKPRITDENSLIQSFRRKTAIHTYRLGHLLTLAKLQVPYGNWTVFLQQMGISISTDDRARDLYNLIDSEEEIKDLSITEAYEKAGINIGKKAKAESVSKESSEPAKPIKLNTTDATEDAEVDEVGDDGDDQPQVTDENDEASSDSDEDDDQPKVPDQLVFSLKTMANELESFATDAIPHISSDERDEIRIAIQNVGVAHQKLLDAFFNAVEAA